MSHEYPRGEFYVRQCYLDYYDMLTRIIKEKKPVPTNYITMTGTPGIGKSVFYIYFFQRWRRENPSGTIVTASFSSERQMESCVVFSPEFPDGNRFHSIPFRISEVNTSTAQQTHIPH